MECILQVNNRRLIWEYYQTQNYTARNFMPHVETIGLETLERYLQAVK